MTLLESWVHTPLAQSLGLALVHSLWEGVLIAVILAAALCVARTSRVRYGAACVALLLMLAGFATTLVRLLPQPLDAAAPRRLAIAPAARASLPIVAADGQSDRSSLAGFLPWIAPFWAAGVLLLQLRALGGWMAARRLRRSGVCRAPDEWQERLNRLAAQLRMSRPAALLESCLAEAPVVIGYLRPVILMPVGLLAGLPVAQVEAILIHELAHIRRQDYLVNLMQTFVEGLLFYHPAVWWISGVIRAERENCCDDLAVAATGDVRGYAAALAALEQNRWAAHELALAATGGSLLKRIRRLLQQPERPRAAWTPLISAGLLVISAGLALASWQTQPAQTLPAPVPAVLPAPVAPVAVELPATPMRKPAPKLLAQTPQTSQTPQAARAVERELQAQLQLATPYRKWLNEDVAYIIIDNERSTFKGLTSDSQREQFIDQFWQRRDPTPGTPENEFKEEHYRRIAYANEHFATTSGLPGWKTDQGRIYITYGPPNEIEDHSSGGSYTRPAEEGGGTISAFPFQQWRYRYIDGIGNNIVIEFIDPTYTREFRMTMDPAEKDALRYVQGTNAPQPANMFVSAGDGPKVTVSITSSASEKKNMYVSFALPSAPARYDVTAQVTDIYDQAVANLKDVTAAGQLNYTSRFTMKPGSYNLKVMVRDPASGAMQTSTVNFYVN